jgi:outer membrane protein OmpA-like peptidoglycan-associated protein
MADRDGNRHHDRSYGHGTGTTPERRRSLIGWLLGAALLVGLLVLVLRGCDDTADRTAAVPGTTTSAGTGRVSDAGDPMVPAGAYRSADFDNYLAGTEPVGRAFALDRVTFATGSSDLDDNARAELAELAGVLRRYPSARIEVVGYADPEGDEAANQTLSRQRAEAVRAALSEAGAAGSAVSLAAEGETGAAATRANRKVEVRVTSR